MTGTTPLTNTRVVLAVFEKYQKERLLFVQTVADLASRESNIEALQGAGVMSLLRPLLLDNVPAIQHAAALALGRLANYNEELAESVVDSDILPQLVFSLAEQNRFYKKAAAFVLRAVSKHSPDLAQSVVDSGALNALVSCLEEFDPGVKESSAWALGYIARHNGDLAQSVVDAGAVPLLVLCVQEPELSLRRIAASALSDIAKHSPEVISHVSPEILIPPLPSHTFSTALSPKSPSTRSISQKQLSTVKSSQTSSTVSKIQMAMSGKTLQRSSVKLQSTRQRFNDREACAIDCQFGGIAAVVDYVNDSRGNARLPGIMTLGYIAAFSETLALSVIVAKGVSPLSQALITEPEEHIKAACAWSLGQIGRHSPDHAKTLADNAVLPKLLKVLTATSGDDVGSDLKTKTKRALKCILEKTLHLEALEPLLMGSTPANILKRAFVTSGALQRLQEIAVSFGEGAGKNVVNAPGVPAALYVRTINECYPEEIVRYYSPGYSNTLWKRGQENGGQQQQQQNAAVKSLVQQAESNAPQALTA
ncbi:armadillo-type protein [Chytridium lagenaria]|nr:armadillo-type protein [Chytridium lagenaria]